MESLDRMAREKLEALEAGRLRRQLVTTARGEGLIAERGGRRLVSFSCNDYLGLSTDPRIVAAAVEATLRFGAGAGASRLVTGNHPLYQDLEARLARLKGTEDAIVFGSGYLANSGIVPALTGPRDLVLVDALAHACIFSGARLSGATVEIFPHNDTDAVEALLAARRREARHCLILTDGVFSMDGDLASLDALAEIAERHDAWLMTDDAHGVGVIGGGRGSACAFDPAPRVPLQMGTLSKAIGAYGGYLCASAPVVDLLRSRARSFVYSTGLPPGTVAAAIAALEVIETEPELVARPVILARRFATAVGLPTPVSPIVPVILGSADTALAAAAELERAGFLVVAIRPPTVPHGTARLRITFAATHTEDDVDRLADAVRQVVTRCDARSS